LRGAAALTHTARRWLQTDGRFARTLNCDRSAVGTLEKVEGEPTRPKPRVVKPPTERRAELIGLAQLLFMTKGYERTTINRPTPSPFGDCHGWD
jgi:hypothetical protein